MYTEKLMRIILTVSIQHIVIAIVLIITQKLLIYEILF